MFFRTAGLCLSRTVLAWKAHALPSVASAQSVPSQPPEQQQKQKYSSFLTSSSALENIDDETLFRKEKVESTSLSSSQSSLIRRREAFVPSTWSSAPNGWFMIPSSSTPIPDELPVFKTFDFLNHSAQCNLLGQVMALAEEVRCFPTVEWFYAELTFILPPTKEAEIIASYANDEERQRCGLRNHSRGGSSASGVLWSDELSRRVRERSEGDFCWALTNDQRRTQKFLQETFVQWHHRADYLVTRKSREKREFRQDLTLHQVIMEGQERKRRMQRRKERASEREKNIKAGKESEWDTFTHDVLPRELREALDRESDGMEDVRLSRMGTATGGWSRTRRSHPNFR